MKPLVLRLVPGLVACLVACLVPGLVLLAWAGGAAALPDGSLPAHALSNGVFVRPLYGVYRHCEGACLKSGALSWYCFERQACHLSCATAPPRMQCAAR